MNKPLLTVCLITYNHENYIGQAIESILMQNVNFSWKLIIADDCSTDQTKSILESYKRKHPDFIQLILRDQNVGAAKNFIELIAAPDSKYIAYLEGDDFWTDSLKLQKQVDFLEAHPDFEVCFTNTRIINFDGDLVKEKLINDKRKTEYVHEDLPIWAPSLTRVFKNRDFEPINKDVPGQDTLWLLYQSKFGKIKFINEVTASYRLHKGGIYSSQTDAKKKEHIVLTDIESLNFIDKPLFLRYFGMIFKKLVELKSLDLNLFKRNRALLVKNYKFYFTNFSFWQHLKIWISFIVISLPFVRKSKWFNQFSIRIINNLLIY